MNFFKVDFGNILTMLSFIVTLYTFHKQNVKRIDQMEFRVGLMWKRFAKRFDLPQNLDRDED